MGKNSAACNCRGAGLRRGFLLAWLGLAASVSAADLTIAVESRWRGTALRVPSAELSNDAGQTLQITRFAALISEVSLLRADGGSTRLDGQFGVIDMESGRRDFALRGVPKGDFVGLEFRLGVPTALNHGDPGRWPAGHALNPLVNGLHWSWQGGYAFAAIEGHYRTAGTETATRGFSFHLATDARVMTVRFLANFRVTGSTRIDLALDLARMLAAHRLAPDDDSESTHSAEGDTLAPRLATALERAWFWLEASATPAPVAERHPVSPTESKANPLPFAVPPGFPQSALPADNPLTAEGVALGEVLFSDVRLSINSTQSCATCHVPAQAFSDAVALSLGAEGHAGKRNAMPLFNLAWSPNYAWDGSQPRIRDQAHAAWVNPIEMHANPPDVIAALVKDAEIVARFRAAFGSPEITAERVTLALEQYLLTLVSADSRFDRSLRGELELTAEEKRGFELFAMEYDPARGRRGADCFHCHGGALFSDYALKNNGLDFTGTDSGRGSATGVVADRGKFKTPSLRNVALTAPYMHDGRFATLEEVVAHYDHGVQRAPTLDPNLAKHPAAGLALPAEDRGALVAFVRALTDERWTTRANK